MRADMKQPAFPITKRLPGVLNGVYEGRWTGFVVHFTEANGLPVKLPIGYDSPFPDYPVTVSIIDQLAIIDSINDPQKTPVQPAATASPAGRPLIEVFAEEKARTQDAIDPVSGFTMAEAACHAALQESYRLFLELPRQHPDEMRDFGDGLHRIQDLFAMRIVRRCYPLGWVTHAEPRQNPSGHQPANVFTTEDYREQRG